MLEGEIGQINLIARLVELWREQFTGAIRFENDGIIKIVYFKNGDILSASTNDRSDSIDEILMRANKVSREHVKQALAKRKENETLGDALLNLGFITRKELTWSRRVQVVGVIRSIAAWETGSFTIVADYLPKRDEGTLFPLPQVLVELIVTEQDRARFERALDGGNAVFSKTADFDDVWRKLGLNEDAEAIANEIDGDKNATEIATASGRDTFNVYKLLDALATLGVLTRTAKPQEQPQFSLDDFASAGVADAADMWNEPAAAPEFALDDEIATAASGPTLEIPAMTFDAEPSAPSAWDDEESVETAAPPVVEPEPPATSRMPSWDTPVREPMAVPIPAPIEPPAEAAEEQWGFDEAQIETAQRATQAPPPITAAPTVAARFAEEQRQPKRRKGGGGRSYGLLVALLVIAILAGAGWFGFQWWQGQQQPAEDLLVRRPAARPVVTPRPATAATDTTGTIVDATTTTATATETAATATIAPPATVTVAPAAPPVIASAPPAAAPAVVTPTPAPAASQTAALPVVTPRNGRDRYDAMARDFAANRTGNFTVQIQILCDPSNLEKAMRAGGDSVWFVPQRLGDRNCYRVFYGRYNTRAEAQSALANVPAAIRDKSSAVKAIAQQ
jgi:hypothetical protein